jgi:hypothetical protein
MSHSSRPTLPLSGDAGATPAVIIEPTWRGPYNRFAKEHKLSGCRRAVMDVMCSRQRGVRAVTRGGAYSLHKATGYSLRWVKRVLKELEGQAWAAPSVRAWRDDKPPEVLSVAIPSLRGGRIRRPKDGSPGCAHEYRMGPALTQYVGVRGVLRGGRPAGGHAFAVGRSLSETIAEHEAHERRLEGTKADVFEAARTAAARSLAEVRPARNEEYFERMGATLANLREAPDGQLVYLPPSRRPDPPPKQRGRRSERRG